jgi:acetyl-CoA acetyltransferase
MRDVWIRGAGLTPFGKHVERTARALVEEAVAGALNEAEIDASLVQAAYVGNAASGLLGGQESIRGQVVLRHTGLMGKPIINVENADASSSTALHLAWQAVAGGLHDCVAVVGYEKFDHRDHARSFRAINATMDLTELADVFGPNAREARSVLTDLYGAQAGGDGSDRFGREVLAQVSVKNHYHGSLNPCAQYREPVSAEQVLGSRVVAGPLTRMMCAPFSDGAACLILSAGDFCRGRGQGEPVRIAASVLTSGRGDDMRRSPSVHGAVHEAYERAAAGPEDLDVAELHDATAIGELLVYELLGFCPNGEAERLVRDRTTWLGGRLPVNPSGGLIARGHPLGATGAAQVIELYWQLSGRCGARQVPHARLALAHNVGGWVGSDLATLCFHVLQR